MEIWRKLSIGFAAGGLGAVANVLFVAAMAHLGLIAAMGISFPPPALPGFLYKQVAWGGLWGFLLIAPVLTQSWLWRGLLIGLLASLGALFVFFPLHTTGDQGPGVAGLNAGALTPVLVLLANSVWGLVAAWWYARLAK